MSRLSTPTLTTACLQCGTEARPGSTFCRRCGLPFGAPPPEHADLPACPVCYREAEADGRLPSLERPGPRLAMPDHVAEHERHPVGNDELLESLRIGDRIRVGRWAAPFDVVRRYLVTGAVEAGHRRRLEHDAIVTAMTQIARWGVGAELFGDQPEWQAARAAVADLMDRYHRR